MKSNDIPVTDTILFKLCRAVFEQYEAQHDHQFNPDLATLHANVENYLSLSVDDVNDEIIITFILRKDDLDG